MGVLAKPLEVKPLANYRLYLCYSDGLEGELDLSSFLDRGVFQAWREEGVFQSVAVSPHGSIYWNEELELCGDALYLQVTGKEPEEVFPNLVAQVNART